MVAINAIIHNSIDAVAAPAELVSVIYIKKNELHCVSILTYIPLSSTMFISKVNECPIYRFIYMT